MYQLLSEGGKILSLLKELNTILLHKKADKEDLTRLTEHLDDQQSKEQAGFNDGQHICFNIIDGVSKRIQVASVTFSDYEKALDNIMQH